MGVVLLTACASLSEKQKFRINSLYEHTLLMKEMSSPALLEDIGLDATVLIQREGMSHDEKLAQTEAAMGIRGSGTYNQRLNIAEKRMNEMMQIWARKIP